ncbi:hypothetical protein ACP70R_039265 [Stipagrostis hirtigluma subsp. patula]
MASLRPWILSSGSKSGLEVEPARLVDRREAAANGACSLGRSIPLPFHHPRTSPTRPRLPSPPARSAQASNASASRLSANPPPRGRRPRRLASAHPIPTMSAADRGEESRKTPSPWQLAAAALVSGRPRCSWRIGFCVSAAERRRRQSVAWLCALLAGSGLPLPPPHASEEDLGAALADGALLRTALRGPGSAPDEGRSSAVAAASDVTDFGSFVVAVQRMGLPSFAASDLDRGRMSAVIICLLALRDRFASHGETWHFDLEEKGRMHSMEFSLRENGHGTQIPEFGEKVWPQKPSSPISRAEISSISQHAGHNFHELFHLRQEGYSGLHITKILEMIKSTRLDNGPNQSLLNFENGILDEIIEKRNAEIPYAATQKQCSN